MKMRTFLDTNILIYLRQNGTDKQAKVQAWLQLLTEHNAAVINLQVINEACHVTLRKEPRLALADLREWIDTLREWGDSALEIADFETASELRRVTGFQWWDCLLLAAADRLACTHFLSEDMAHDRRVLGLTIVNPFAVAPSALLAPS